MANHRLASRGPERDLTPPNFLALARINARAQRARHQLGPKTYADRRPLRAQPHFKQVQLVFERRIKIIFVCADWSAEHDDEIRRNRIQRCDVIDPAIGVTDAIAGALERWLQAARSSKCTCLIAIAVFMSGWTRSSACCASRRRVKRPL